MPAGADGRPPTAGYGPAMEPMEKVHDPIGRQWFSFTPGAADDGTDTVVVECWVDPSGGVPPHIHPHFEEVFEVLEGEMTFTAGRAKEVRRAGESITVPPGTRHAYANRSDAPAYMRCTATPAADLREFLETTARLGRENKLFRLGPIRGPKGLQGLRETAAMLKRHRENTLILNPPPLVQRLLLDRIAERP
jgi:quercetin dioxygenase-like cupin family protein